MQNHEQVFDEMLLDEGDDFAARATIVAERNANAGAVARSARGHADREPAMAYACDAFGKYIPRKPPGRANAIDPDEVRSEVARARKLKSNFLASASYELRQPAQALALLLPSIERQVATNPRAHKTIDMMRQAVDGLNGLLGAMLEISYLDADLIKPSMKTVDVGALLRRLSTEYAEKASLLGLRFRVFAPEAFAISDSHLLEKTLRRLIENALRFTSSGGVLVGLRRRCGRIRIDVIDTGVGVPTGRQSEIFEEFVHFETPGQQSEKGLGLGLAIASRHAALLGADIKLRSRLGKGSRFSLWLPKSAAPDCFGYIEGAGGKGRSRVLIVENDAILRFALESLVEQWGYEACAAADADEAFKRGENDDMRFDLVITDYDIGNGSTGVQMVKELERRAGRRFPALVLMGETDEEALTDIVASGIDVAHKPISPDDLQRRFSGLQPSMNR
ncbi:hybrid sensor histidine kinase/response regulator [Rhodoblastus sp.]|jgi:signal transduction histidine kinase|uniref:hybrid sensor histidine kinase/response regulator n=1 Tax=Rhodoblastus sp. TaxID=1962975 RepID=UPI0025CD0B11|nr:hybrid sensor histidine kinase/response regulator [Rhodoblastus sp.]